MRCFLTCCFTFIFLSSGIPFGCQTDSSYAQRLPLRDSIDAVTTLAYDFLLEGQLDTALQLSLWTLEESERISYLFGQSESHSRLGSIYDEKEQYDQALEELLTSHELRKELLSIEDSILYEKRLVSSFNNLSITYSNMGDYAEALAKIQDGLRFIEQHKKAWPHKLVVGNMRSLLHSKGNIFYDWGKLDSAIAYYQASLKLAEPRDLHPGYTDITGYQLVIIYSELGIQDTLLDELFRKNRDNQSFMTGLWEAKGQRLIDQGKYEAARDTIYKSLEARTKTKDTIGMGMNRYNLGISYLNEREYEEAKAQLEFALDLYESQQQETRLAEALTSLSILAHAKDHTGEALVYSEKAYQYAIEAEDLEEAARAATQLVTLHEKMNDVPSAFFFQQKYRNHRDTLNAHRESAIQMAEESRRKAEVQAVKLANAQERSRLTNIASAFIITILLLLLYFIIRQAIQNRKMAAYKLKEKETAQEYLQHQRKGANDERERIAHNLHDGVGQLLISANNMVGEVGKASTELQDELLDQLHKAESWISDASKKLRLITRVMAAEAFRGFGIKGWAHELKDQVESSTDITVNVKCHRIDKPLNEEAELQVILVMQELVTNAQRYSKAKEINIQLIRDEADLSMTIDDDGVGFDVDKILRRKKKGLGLRSIRARVEENLSGKITFDSVIGDGSTTMIEIPQILILENKTNENHV